MKAGGCCGTRFASCLPGDSGARYLAGLLRRGAVVQKLPGP